MRKFFAIIISLFVLGINAWGDATQPLNFTAVNGPATISLDTVGNPSQVSLQYSTDNCSTWNSYQIEQEIQLATGEKVFFKATSNNAVFSSNDVNHYYFVMT